MMSNYMNDVIIPKYLLAQERSYEKLLTAKHNKQVNIQIIYTSITYTYV